jgi:hypothetical protein
MNPGEQGYYKYAPTNEAYPRLSFRDNSGRLWNRTFYGALNQGGGASKYRPEHKPQGAAAESPQNKNVEDAGEILPANE